MIRVIVKDVGLAKNFEQSFKIFNHVPCTNALTNGMYTTSTNSLNKALVKPKQIYKKSLVFKRFYHENLYNL